MSYSPTVYCASIFTPRLSCQLASRPSAATPPAADIGERPGLVHRRPARVLVEVLDQPRRGVRVEVIDQRLVADVDLILLQHRRHGHDDRELLRIPLKSFAIVSTVRSPSRTSTTCDALLNSFVSALAT